MSRPAVAIPAVSLLLAALTLLLPSSPTYDPWSWILWGREITHGDLVTTLGPSWKPLPMLFTIPFSLAGHAAAPALWLLVARAGGIAGVGMAFMLGRRLAGPVGAAAAAGGLIVAPYYVRNVALGNSEGLMAALVLLSIDCHLSGRERGAYLAALGGALLRPEAWPFFGLYGLWLLWRQRGDALLLVLAGYAAIPVLWFGPELWGSGDLFRAADRAQKPLKGSAAFSDHPAVKTVTNFLELVTWPVWAGLAVAVVLLATRRVGRERSLVLGGFIALTVLWVGEVAFMTRGGFSGNTRYLIVPAVLAMVAGALGVGWLAEWAGARASKAMVPVAAVVVAVLFAVPAFHKLPKVRRDLAYQGALPHHLADAVRDAGGPARLRACGPAYTGPFLVPAVAWQLHAHIDQVKIFPKAPGVIFRENTNPHSMGVPSLKTLGGAPTRTLARRPGWRLLGACRQDAP